MGGQKPLACLNVVVLRLVVDKVLQSEDSESLVIVWVISQWKNSSLMDEFETSFETRSEGYLTTCLRDNFYHLNTGHVRYLACDCIFKHIYWISIVHITSNGALSWFSILIMYSSPSVPWGLWKLVPIVTVAPTMSMLPFCKLPNGINSVFESSTSEASISCKKWV